MQSSLPVGWLAFTGRESNPLDHDERFQITFSSSLPGLILTQRSRNSKEHGFGIDALQNSNQCHQIRLSKSSGESRFNPAEIRSKINLDLVERASIMAFDQSSGISARSSWLSLATLSCGSAALLILY